MGRECLKSKGKGLQGMPVNNKLNEKREGGGVMSERDRKHHTGRR